MYVEVWVEVWVEVGDLFLFTLISSSNLWNCWCGLTHIHPLFLKCINIKCKLSSPFTIGHNGSLYDDVIHVALIAWSRVANYKLPTSSGSRLNTRNFPGSRLHCNCQPLKNFTDRTKLRKFSFVIISRSMVYPLQGMHPCIPVGVYMGVYFNYSHIKYTVQSSNATSTISLFPRLSAYTCEPGNEARVLCVEKDLTWHIYTWYGCNERASN